MVSGSEEREKFVPRKQSERLLLSRAGCLSVHTIFPLTNISSFQFPCNLRCRWVRVSLFEIFDFRIFFT